MKKLFLLGCALTMAACSGAAETVSQTGSATPSTEMVNALPTVSGANIWTVDYSASTLQFNAVHAGNTFTGDFNSFSAVIKLDPENPEDGEVHVVVDIASVDANDDDRNANLPEKDWFNIKAFPYAKFSATDITRVSGNDYIARGDLSIKGISQPTQLDFQLTIDGDRAKASGTTTLMRPDFKLGTDSSDFKTEEWVAFPVKVRFVVSADRQ